MYVVEYRELGHTFHAYVCGTSGGVYGLQAGVFPAPQYAAMVAAVNTFGWSKLKTNALSYVRLVRALRRFGRFLLLSPVLVAGLIGMSLSTFMHAAGLLRSRTRLKASWEAQKAAEVAAQALPGVSDAWVWRFGGGVDTASNVPPAPGDLGRRMEHGLAVLKSGHEGVATVLSAPGDVPTVGSLDPEVVTTLSWVYEALGVPGVGPHASDRVVKACFRREHARALAAGDGEGASVLKVVYGGLVQHSTRQVIDACWWLRRGDTLSPLQ